MDETQITAILSAFDTKLATDPQIRVILRKITGGKASFADTEDYAIRTGYLLGLFLSGKILDISPEDRETLCAALLKNRYTDLNKLLDAVQRAQDKPLGISLNPIKAPFPAERVQQVAHSLLDPGVKPEVIRRRANAPVATVAKSFHDDYIRINAQKRNDLGFKCYLNRVAVNGCCSWCTEVAGRYVYGDHPADIFRRHDNCDCTVTFENGRQRQDVWSKRTWEETDPQEVMQNASEPTVLSQDAAESLQNAALEMLTKPGQGDIINTRSMAQPPKIKWMPKGEELSSSVRKELTEYAKAQNIVLTGLRHSDVDAELIKESVDIAASMLALFPEINNNPEMPFTLKVVNGLDSNTLAQTTRRKNINVLQLNANAYRDAAKLAAEYSKLVGDHWFVNGTDRSSIIRHEIGHMYQTAHKITDQAIMETAMRVAGIDDRKALFEYLKENLSEYSSSYKDGSEIISEVFSDYFSNEKPTEFSQKFMKALKEMG